MCCLMSFEICVFCAREALIPGDPRSGDTVGRDWKKERPNATGGVPREFRG